VLNRASGALLATCLLAVACLTSACGTKRPTPPVQAALFEDAGRIVEPAETTGWFVDRIEVEKLAPAMFQSACQTTPADRIAVLDWIDASIAAQGGPAKAAYARLGQDKDTVSELLFLERIRHLIAHVNERAEADCPFWLTADPEFAGVQSDYARFVMLAESRGQLAITVADGDVGVGGGGQGRVLFGSGFSHDVSLYAGLELGAAAIFVRQPDGTRDLTATLVGGFPVILRFNAMSRFTDIELALTGIYSEEEGRVNPGFRVAVAYGTITERIGAFQPMLGFWVGYEVYPATDTEPVTHLIGVGTRFGLNIDP
jgi:hypothetical protein